MPVWILVSGVSSRDVMWTYNFETYMSWEDYFTVDHKYEIRPALHQPKIRLKLPTAKYKIQVDPNHSSCFMQMEEQMKYTVEVNIWH